MTFTDLIAAAALVVSIGAAGLAWRSIVEARRANGIADEALSLSKRGEEREAARFTAHISEDEKEVVIRNDGHSTAYLDRMTVRRGSLSWNGSAWMNLDPGAQKSVFLNNFPPQRGDEVTITWARESHRSGEKLKWSAEL